MCFWRRVWEISWVHGYPTRYRSKPRSNHRHPQFKATKNCQGSLEVNQYGNSFEPFYFLVSREKCRPFFDLIKKGKNFHWGDQSDRAFEQLKAYLSTVPLLSTPVNEESLYIYLAASEHAVSAAIVREDYNIQKPVYYTSKTLDGAESRYLPLEKLAFALVCSAKKLPHYFQAHTMIV